MTVSTDSFRAQRGTTFPIALFVVAVVLSGAITGTAVIQKWPHYELIGIACQFGLILPAFLLQLRMRETNAVRGGFLTPHRGVAVIVIAYLIAAAIVGWYVGRGIALPDEAAYRHQAKILASGRLFADAPPGSVLEGGKPPLPIRFEHEIILPSKGWFGKYPIGWPIVLALPERLGLGWLACPILAAFTLILVGKIARESIGEEAEFLAVAMTALSPYFFSISVGRMAHALMSVLVAGATLAFIRGIKTGRISFFAWMFAYLVFGFHVRPFTAFITAVVLGTALLMMTFRDTRRFALVATMGFGAAIVSVVSLLLYNWLFTGHALLSPYSLSRGETGAPREISANLAVFLRNLETMWRFSAEATWLYTFPLVAVAAGYGFWAFRRRSKFTYVLAALGLSIVVAHFVQVESSSSVLGERYWTEAYFCLTVLASGAIVVLVEKGFGTRRMWNTAAISLAAFGVLMIASALVRLWEVVEPRADYMQEAGKYANCHCVLFMTDTEDVCTSWMDLNAGNWKRADVFYARDPGKDLRPEWASKLGHEKYTVMRPDGVPGEACLPGN
jgi:hypothetical protein